MKSETSFDPGSLDLLHDIIVPPAVSVWPPAPGWILLASTVALGLGMLVARALRRRRRDRYRREALTVLERLRTDALQGSGSELAGALLVLLRRTALSVHPRRETASLSGPAWWRFLDEQGGEIAFSRGLGEELEALAYRASIDAGNDERLRVLMDAVETWIREHRPSTRVARTGLSTGKARQ